METNRGVNKISRDEKFWFSTDTHFGHKNIIRFCQHRFVDAEEMNYVLVDNWDCVVGDDDLVFNLGDSFVGDAAEWTSLLKKPFLTTAKRTPMLW